VGDLLTFPIRPVSTDIDRCPGGCLGQGLDQVGQGPDPAPAADDRRTQLGLRPRMGLRRGTPATSWYDTGWRLETVDPDAARMAYQRAVAGRPDLADAHNNLGRLLHDAGDTAGAESCYRLAICADAGVALYWFNLGVAVEDQARHAEAIAAYERAIELDARAADAHYNLARLLELKGRRAGDDRMLHRAVRLLLRYRDLARRNAG
jgi:tetratricopeptide (TPR) repeat protein